MPDHVVALTTTPTQEEAESLAHLMLEQRLAACVQISQPIRSIYRWQGEVCTDEEWQLWIKTAADRVDALTAWLPDHHSEDCPELVVLPIVDGSPDYLAWVTDETR